MRVSPYYCKVSNVCVPNLHWDFRLSRAIVCWLSLFTLMSLRWLNDTPLVSVHSMCHSTRVVMAAWLAMVGKAYPPHSRYFYTLINMILNQSFLTLFYNEEWEQFKVQQRWWVASDFDWVSVVCSLIHSLQKGHCVAQTMCSIDRGYPDCCRV